MQEKKQYAGANDGQATVVFKNISYSTDPADLNYIQRNIPCQAACPAGTNIPGYIRCLYEGRYDRAYELNRIVNLFPGILGRICSRPCEEACRHGEAGLGQPVNICHLKRAAADYKQAGHVYMQELLAPQGKQVAIVGAGPAGLAAASELTCLGLHVTLYDMFAQPGGMLRYGIPEFRLPRDILDQEINNVLRLGIEWRPQTRIGQDIAVSALQEQYDAVLLALGCYQPLRLNIPGEDLPGVYVGLDFMMAINRGQPPAVGERVLVIGGGFTAMDCARSALRLGAQEVSVCVRRLEEDLNVTAAEILETKREGVKLRTLLSPQRIIGSERVKAVLFQRTRPGPLDARGRHQISLIAGSDFEVAADTVIIATGQAPAPLEAPGEKNQQGVLVCDPHTYRTTADKIYLAGDFVSGASTVIEAIGMGRQAAWQIAADLVGRPLKERAVRIEPYGSTDRQRAWDYLPPQAMPHCSIETRRTQPQAEVETGYSPETTRTEAQRCYLCYLHYEIDINECIYCSYCIDVAPRDCIKLVKEIKLDEQGAVLELVPTRKWREVHAVVIDNARCIRCGACLRVCPVDCISVSKVEQVERLVAAGR